MTPSNFLQWREGNNHYIPPPGIEPGSQPIAGCALTTKLQRSLVTGAVSELILQLQECNATGAVRPSIGMLIKISILLTVPSCLEEITITRIRLDSYVDHKLTDIQGSLVAVSGRCKVVDCILDISSG